MTSVTMASRCLDNLLPPGAQKQREADYLCLTVTHAIMYHRDGSTVSTTGVPSAPQPVGTEPACIHTSSSPGGRSPLLPGVLPALLVLVGSVFWLSSLMCKAAEGRGKPWVKDRSWTPLCHLWGLQWEGRGKAGGRLTQLGVSCCPCGPCPDLGQVALPLGGIVFSFVQQDDISLEC